MLFVSGVTAVSCIPAISGSLSFLMLQLLLASLLLLTFLVLLAFLCCVPLSLLFLAFMLLLESLLLLAPLILPSYFSWCLYILCTVHLCTMYVHFKKIHIRLSDYMTTHYGYRTVFFLWHWTIGLSKIGYRIKASVHRTVGDRTSQKNRGSPALLDSTFKVPYILFSNFPFQTI